MVTWAVAFALVAGGLVWAAVEHRRRRERPGMHVAIAEACLATLIVIGAIIVLFKTDNPWAWIGLPMACRYTLRGC